MITIHGMSEALYVIESSGLNHASLGQAEIWADIINWAMPHVLDGDAIRAAGVLVSKRIDEPRPRWCATLGELLHELRLDMEIQLGMTAIEIKALRDQEATDEIQRRADVEEINRELALRREAQR